MYIYHATKLHRKLSILFCIIVIQAYALLLKLDSASHQLTLDQGFLNVKWRKFKVFGGLQVNRCYKYSRHGHIITSNVVICPKCSVSHDLDECNSDTAKYINCHEANLKFNLSINTGHPAYSPSCQTMCQKLNKFRASISVHK